MKISNLFFMIIISILAVGSFCLSKSQNPWTGVLAPTFPPTESVGTYTAGCLRGAAVLPKDGPGYQVMRLSRRRYFGHPVLLDFLQKLALQVKQKTNQDILIGDMGLPRGGPALSGHASHQIGLDVDIWFYQPPVGKIFTDVERETQGAPSMVVPEFEGLTSDWSSQKLVLLETAAQSPEVERIFVNPILKRAACQTHRGSLWLQKLRPWWFHEEHFHVRLRCQPGNLKCEGQNPVPDGDGCGDELNSWFTPENKAKEKYMRTHPTAPVMPTLPAECASVLTETP